MHTNQIGNSSLETSRIIYGCMTIGGSWDREPVPVETRKEAMAAVYAALDAGINIFDHADIYSMGKSEAVFSTLWENSPGLREKVYLQSKCGIRFKDDPSPGDPGRYDFSYTHIIRSVNGSLQRLKTDYLDLLLLHRPDPLIEPEEVARAFAELQQSGKVRYFGVSNHTAAQIALLEEYLDMPLMANQVELNVIHTQLLDAGIAFNQDVPPVPLRGEGTLEYCRLHKITLQAWAPLAGGALTGKSLPNPPERYQKAAQCVAEIANEKGVAPEAILIAWLLRIPGGVMPVIGTTNPERIHRAAEGDQVELSREEWYRLFVAGRGSPLP